MYSDERVSVSESEVDVEEEEFGARALDHTKFVHAESADNTDPPEAGQGITFGYDARRKKTISPIMAL